MSVEFSEKSLKRARVLLDRARRSHADLSQVEALCARADSHDEVLMRNTIGNYRHMYAAALALVADQGATSETEIRAARDRIERTLNPRRGRPPTPRTSAKKVKKAKEWMVKSVFTKLKHSAMRLRRLRPAMTALYCLVQPRLGVRPIELHTANFAGDLLMVRNAKRKDSSYRQLDVSSWDPSHKMALAVLIEMAREEIREVGYDAWLSRVAECLARACHAVPGVPRLCPSGFRHIALSTWHASGYTVEEIAALAGHLLPTSSRHYIHKSAAWAMAKHHAVSSASSVPRPDAEAVWEDYPRPQPKVETPKPRIDARAYFERSLQVPAVTGNDPMPSLKQDAGPSAVSPAMPRAR